MRARGVTLCGNLLVGNPYSRRPPPARRHTRHFLGLFPKVRRHFQKWARRCEPAIVVIFAPRDESATFPGPVHLQATASTTVPASGHVSVHQNGSCLVAIGTTHDNEALEKASWSQITATVQPNAIWDGSGPKALAELPQPLT